MGNFNKNLMQDMPGAGSAEEIRENQKKGNLKLIAAVAIIIIAAVIIVPILMEVL